MTLTGGGEPIVTLDNLAHEWLRANYPAPETDKVPYFLGYVDLVRAFKAGWLAKKHRTEEQDATG